MRTLPHIEVVDGMAWHPQKHVLLCTTNRGIHVWNSQTAKKTQYIRASAPHYVEYLPGEKYFVCAIDYGVSMHIYARHLVLVDGELDGPGRVGDQV
jgi:hypothetical protein